MSEQTPAGDQPAVLFVDNHLLVVAKPTGMPSQRDETGDPDMLEWSRMWVKKQYDKPGNVYIGLVHRLDRPASGVMVFARTSKAAARLAAQFRERTVKKRYFAIVQGNLQGEGEWTDFIAKSGRSPSIVPSGAPGAGRARLRWRALRELDGKTMVDVDLLTGRPHQIRLQFSSRGYPLVGDFRYGADMPLDGRNLALHCWMLDIKHPVRSERLRFTAPPPAVWPSECRLVASDMAWPPNQDTP